MMVTILNMKALIEKYNKISLPARAALWVAFAQFLKTGLHMLTTPFFTRILDTSEYGRVSTFMSWCDVLVILITLSVWRGILNLYKKDYNKDQVLAFVFSLSYSVGFVFSAIMLIFYECINQLINLPQILYFCLIIFVFSQNIMIAWTVRMQYDYKYKSIVAYSISFSFISLFGEVLSVLFIKNVAESMIIPQVLCITVFSTVVSIWYFSEYGFRKNNYIWKFCLFFAIPLIPHYLSEVVLHSSDRIMINDMCGSSEVAVYSIAYSVASIICLITSAVNSSFVPYQYQKITNKEYAVLARNTNYIFIFIAGCSLPIMMFSQEIVAIFAGSKYHESVNLIIPITIGVFFNYMFQLFARVQEYFEQKYTIVISSVSCALLNLILNYFFIRIYGYYAAAYTTLICYLLFCIMHYFFYRMACKKNIGIEIYDVKSLAFISVMLCVVSFNIYLVNKIPLIKYFVLFIFCILIYVYKDKMNKFVKNLRGS